MSLNEEKLDRLIEALEENTLICKYLAKMISENNKETTFLYQQKKTDLTTTQMIKNFGLNVAANIVGDVLSLNTDKNK